MLSLEGPQGQELTYRGHVNRLLSKLPKHYGDSFIKHLQLRGRLNTDSLNPYNLHDLADWLKVKAEALSYQTERVQVPCKEHQPVLKPQTRPTEQILKWIKDGKRCWKCWCTSQKCEECMLKRNLAKNVAIYTMESCITLPRRVLTLCYLQHLRIKHTWPPLVFSF